MSIISHFQYFFNYLCGFIFVALPLGAPHRDDSTFLPWGQITLFDTNLVCEHACMPASLVIMVQVHEVHRSASLPYACSKISEMGPQTQRERLRLDLGINRSLTH